MDCRLSWLILGGVLLHAQIAFGLTPPSVESAVADPRRPPDQISLDGVRKPAELLSFAGLKSGDWVADFMPGNAYFTRILSVLVGAKGRIVAFTPTEQLEHCDKSETAGIRTIAHDRTYGNVVFVVAPVAGFAVTQKLDAIWISQNYHDLHDKFLGPPDVGRLDRRFFDSLRPGGVLMVIDHASASGAGLRDTETLHRIDPASVRSELEAAGFIFDGELNALRNGADDHSMSVFDPAIRGQTDQFVYRFKRPL